ADEEAGPEREDYQSEPQILPRAGAGDEQGQREAQQQAERGGGRGDPDGLYEDGGVEGIEESSVVFERPGRFDAAVGSAGEQAVDGDQGEGHRDGQDADDGRRTEESCAEFHGRRTS